MVVSILLLGGCSNEDWLREYLPEDARDAERVFARETYFTIPSCSVAAYKPLVPVELGGDFRTGPIADAVSDTSILYRIIGTAEDDCASPAEFGFSRNGYYDLMEASSVRYKWGRGNEIVIFVPESGLFWVFTAGT